MRRSRLLKEAANLRVYVGLLYEYICCSMRHYRAFLFVLLHVGERRRFFFSFVSCEGTALGVGQTAIGTGAAFTNLAFQLYLLPH